MGGGKRRIDANTGNKIQREMERDKAKKNSRPPGNQNYPPATGEPGPASPTLVGAPRPCLAQIMGPGRTREYCVVCKLVDALWKKG